MAANRSWSEWKWFEKLQCVGRVAREAGRKKRAEKSEKEARSRERRFGREEQVTGQQSEVS